MSLSADIKDYALDLGYSKAGFTTADGFPEYINQLTTRYDEYSFYIERPTQPLKAANPRSVRPPAKSILVLAYDYARESFPKQLTGKIGRAYQARCYRPAPNRIHGARYRLMRDFLTKNGGNVDSELKVPERLAASRAGVTTYGKNSFAYLDEAGSFVIIDTFLIDVEFRYDEPTYEVSCPPQCTACIKACPTGALYEPMKVDPRRCIAFNHWVTQSDHYYPGGVGGYIDPEIRAKMGSWIHGCDICQEVCPRNRARLKAKLPPNQFLNKIAEEFELRKLLHLSEEFYTTIVQPVMYNYIRHRKYFQRNAAIALGNSGDPAYLPDLAQAVQDVEGMVRGYAAWALGRIGGGKARSILGAALTRETDRFAIAEMKAALEVA
jgi:epoxyqueuosine reductase